MTNHVSLAEFESVAVDLSAGDLHWIQVHYPGRFDIAKPLTGSGVLLNPGSNVGVLGMPSGLILQIQPKVPVANTLYMLSVAYEQADPFLLAEADTGTLEGVLPVIARYFVGQVEDLISKGLLRGYQEQEANLSSIRGRISIVEDIRQNHLLRHRVHCRFSELVWDIPENRVIRQVVRCLMGMGLDSGLRQMLGALDDILMDVEPGDMTVADIDRFLYHRMNSHYRQLHRLCRMILNLISPTEQGAGTSTPSFLMDMNRLFERYVAVSLQTSARGRLDVLDQYRTSLDVAGKVPIRPDLVIVDRGSYIRIIDCKYKRLGEGEHRQADLYQMIAYCTALNVGQGMLIYPRHLVDVRNDVSVRAVEMSVREWSLDVSGDIANMQRAVAFLVSDVLPDSSFTVCSA